MCYGDIGPFWYSDAKMTDFGGSLPKGVTQGNGADGLAREGNLDILLLGTGNRCLQAFG